MNLVLKCAFSSSKLNVAHINLGTFKKHKTEVERLLHGTNLDVLAVSETWFSNAINSNLVKINGFTLFRHDRKRRDVSNGGGVALFIKSSLNVKVIAESRSNGRISFCRNFKSR